MNIEELRKLSSDKLQNELTALLEEKLKLMMQKGTGKMAKNHLLGQVKRNIARVKTVMNESR